MALLRVSVVVLAVVSVVLVVDWAEPDGASAKCWPNRENNGVYYWSGWIKTPYQTMTGVQAQIENYSPWVQPGHVGAAWSMLTRTSRDGWAQIGWLEYAYDVRKTFIQYTKASGGVSHYEFAPRPLGDFSRYEVQYNVYSGTGYFEFYLNGSWYLSTNVPRFTPNRGDISAEITTYANQMPGGYNSPESLWYGYYRLSDGVWRYFDGTEANTLYLFGWQRLNAQNINVWDWICPN